jgi:hypothetical protein
MLTRSDEMARYANNILTLGESGSLKSFETSTEWISRNLLSDDTSDETLQETDSNELEEEQNPVSRAAKKPKDERAAEQINRQDGDVAVWSYYAKSAGLLSVFLLAFFTAVATTGTAFPRKSGIQSILIINNVNKVSGLWLKDSTDKHEPTLGVFIGVYAAATVITYIFTVAMLW